MNVLDLFSGIGGFSLGLERAGMRTKAFCEIDPYCQAVLRKHWPDVPIHTDVRTLTAETLADSASKNAGELGHKDQRSRSRAAQARGDNRIDLICGGFPCQDISVAGKGAGIEGARSGLWTEYARIIGEVRPRYVIVENVAALLGRGIGVVLGDLAALRYDAEWHCIPASAVGAPHRRDRVWIIAVTPDERSGGINDNRQREKQSISHWLSRQLRGMGGDAIQCEWLAEPDVGRVAHGVSARVDRLRTLGNAIVPQIAEIIGRAIITSLRGD